MKLTTLLIAIAILQVSAATYGQKVTISVKNASLLTVFDDIKAQTGYDFMISTTILKSANKVSITVKNAELEDVLKQLFHDQPLTYEVDNKSILVKQKETSLLTNLKDKASKVFNLPADILVKVTDSLGQPLVGASVSLKGTRYNALTDNKGDFYLPAVPQGKYTLIVSYIGYAKSESNIVIDGKTLNLTVVLHTSTSALDQVQIIAYGSESKRFSVGAVTTVSADVIEKQPVTNPLTALQGQVPGLAINSTTGTPGSQVLVQIRGQNTLNPNTSLNKGYDQPLFIIDGVPFAPQNNVVSQLYSVANVLPSSGGISQTGGISPFNNINPNDIESISILRDADATSIYGTQGSNGVIIITTKKENPVKQPLTLTLIPASIRLPVPYNY